MPAAASCPSGGEILALEPHQLRKAGVVAALGGQPLQPSDRWQPLE
jgi:hypothetical protein